MKTLSRFSRAMQFLLCFIFYMGHHHLACAATPAATAADPVFSIQRVYLKEASLNQPNSPAIFLENETPKIDVTLDVGSALLDKKGIYESTVTVTVTARIKDKDAFIVKATQGGIFEIRNIPANQFDSLLGIGCPTVIYPYLRANIADMITRAGFPPVHMAEVNFEKFYQNRLEEAKKKK